MHVIRWMILVGFLVFALGILFLTYGSNERVGFNLALTGFVLTLLGVVAGNWIASYSSDAGRYGKAHRVAVIGFCISIVGIVLDESFPDIGVFIMVGGLCVMFIGFIVSIMKINRE